MRKQINHSLALCFSSFLTLFLLLLTNNVFSDDSTSSIVFEPYSQTSSTAIGFLKFIQKADPTAQIRDVNMVPLSSAGDPYSKILITLKFKGYIKVGNPQTLFYADPHSSAQRLVLAIGSDGELLDFRMISLEENEKLIGAIPLTNAVPFYYTLVIEKALSPLSQDTTGSITQFLVSTIDISPTSVGPKTPRILV